MTRIITGALLLLIAFAAGAGVGLLITKTAIAAKQAEIDSLSAELKGVRTKSDQQLMTAMDETAKLKALLTRSENDKSRINTELARTRAQMSQLENALKQLSQPETAVAAPVPAAIPAAAASSQTPAAPPAVIVPKPAAGEYVVKEGDSFWKIAAEQLGSGARFQQIIDLNPQVDPKKPLALGTKLKLPQR